MVDEPLPCPPLFRLATSRGKGYQHNRVVHDFSVDPQFCGVSNLVSPVSGVKHDGGKPRVELLFDGMPLALLEVSKVLTFGAEKYDDHNWLIVPDGRKRYSGAEGRHRLAGETKDEESGLDHEAHKLCSALFAYELKLREQDK